MKAGGWLDRHLSGALTVAVFTCLILASVLAWQNRPIAQQPSAFCDVKDGAFPLQRVLDRQPISVSKSSVVRVRARKCFTRDVAISGDNAWYCDDENGTERYVVGEPQSGAAVRLKGRVDTTYANVIPQAVRVVVEAEGPTVCRLKGTNYVNQFSVSWRVEDVHFVP